MIGALKSFEPFFGEWQLEHSLGSGAWGEVWQIRNGQYISALKELRVEMGPRDLHRMRFEGLDEANFEIYVNSVFEKTFREYEIMNEMSFSEYTVHCFEYMKKEERSEDSIEFLLLFRMEKHLTLGERFTERPPTIYDVIRLGIHICRALEDCKKREIYHRDVAPKNILYCEKTDTYKLSDFGTALKATEDIDMPEKPGTYAAPEVYLRNDYSWQTDLYALGIIMYRMINDYRLPFLPMYPTPHTQYDRSHALFRRYQGEIPPEPRVVLLGKKKKASAKEMTGLGAIVTDDTIDLAIALAGVVQKAIHPDKEQRFETATEMRIALESLL